MALSHNQPSINKFGLTEDYDIHDDDSNMVNPINDHRTNLDDLENVAGFNQPGKRNARYGFRLSSMGTYERVKINDPDKLDKNVEKNVLMNIFLDKNDNWKMVKAKHDWDVDIRVKNNNIVYKPETKEVQRIFNTGTIFGNFVPARSFEDTAIIARHHKTYYLACGRKKGNAVFEFHTKFIDELNMIKDPPEGSVCFIDGILLTDTTDKLVLLGGLKIEIKGLTSPKYFGIKIRKDKDNYAIRSIPPELDIETTEDEIDCSNINIVQNVYMISRFSFSKETITDEEISYL